MDPRKFQAEAAVAYRAGDLAGAMRALERAAELDPAEPDYPRNMAELAREAGDRARAVELTGRAAELTRQAPTAARLNMLSAAWVDLGERLKGLEAAAEALALEDTPTSRALIASALRHLTEVPAPYRPLLVRALAEGWHGEELHRPAAAILRQSWPASLEDLAKDPLLAAVLGTSAVKDAVLEERLTELRRTLLFGALTGPTATLLARLAGQCFLNEYAWGVTAEEAQAVAGLASGERTPANLLRIAAYRSLGGLEDADALLAASWPPPVAAILRQQVAEPRRERELAEGLPALTLVRDTVSQAVREMYEANPYPRWTKAAGPRPVPLARVLLAQFPRADIAPIPNADAPSILVAGCGTGAHALHVAGRYAGARVLAIDLSRASLAYAARKTAEMGVSNVRYAQADLLELVGVEFDLIEAAGVLHHMADPEAGARKLVSLTRPGGVLRLGLYSAAARRHLKAAQDLARGYAPDPQGIRDLRQAILKAPPGDPVREALSSGDFFSASNCRDLLMHVVEHQHTVADLKRIVADNGLRLLGFVVAPEILALYRAEFPDDPAAVDLDRWEAFEAGRPQTFRGMYQFWVQKIVA